MGQEFRRHGLYRRLHSRVWDSDDFTRLSRILPSGRSLWLWLLLGRHVTNLPGLWRLSRAEACDELEWSTEEFDAVWSEVSTSPTSGREPMVVADWRRKVVWVPRAIHYALPTNANAVTGWANAYADVPDCKLKSRAGLHMAEVIEGEGLLSKEWEWIRDRTLEAAQGCREAGIGRAIERRPKGDRTPSEGHPDADRMPIEGRSNQNKDKDQEEDQDQEKDQKATGSSARSRDRSGPHPGTRVSLSAETIGQLALVARKWPKDLEGVGRVVADAIRAGEPEEAVRKAIESLLSSHRQIKAPTAYMAKVLRVEGPNVCARMEEQRGGEFKRAGSTGTLRQLIEAAREAAQAGNREEIRD